MSTQDITFHKHESTGRRNTYDLDNESGETVGIVRATQRNGTVFLEIEQWTPSLVVEVENIGAVRFSEEGAVITMLHGHFQNGSCSECGGRWGSVNDPLVAEGDTEIHQSCKTKIEEASQ